MRCPPALPRASLTTIIVPKRTERTACRLHEPASNRSPCFTISMLAEACHRPVQQWSESRSGLLKQDYYWVFSNRAGLIDNGAADRNALKLSIKPTCLHTYSFSRGRTHFESFRAPSVRPEGWKPYHPLHFAMKRPPSTSTLARYRHGPQFRGFI